MKAVIVTAYPKRYKAPTPEDSTFESVLRVLLQREDGKEIATYASYIFDYETKTVKLDFVFLTCDEEYKLMKEVDFIEGEIEGVKGKFYRTSERIEVVKAVGPVVHLEYTYRRD